MESWFLTGSHAQNYEAGIDPMTPYQGENSGYMFLAALTCQFAISASHGPLSRRKRAKLINCKRLCCR